MQRVVRADLAVEAVNDAQWHANGGREILQEGSKELS